MDQDYVRSINPRIGDLIEETDQAELSINGPDMIARTGQRFPTTGAACVKQTIEAAPERRAGSV